MTQKIKNSATPGKAMLAAISGYAMDGFDLLILGFMLPAISVSLALDASQAGSLVTWTLVGARYWAAWCLATSATGLAASAS